LLNTLRVSKMKLSVQEKKLLQQFRVLLKEAKISIECRDLILYTNKAVVHVDTLMTCSDYGEDYEMYFVLKKTKVECSKLRTHKGKIVTHA
jgi:hypothetical protein